MKGIVIAAVVIGIAIVIAAVAASLILTSTPLAKANAVITGFGKGSGDVINSNNGTLVFIDPFNVTVVNQGSSEVSGLTVLVEVLGNGNVLGSENAQIGTLQAGSQYSISDILVTFSVNPSQQETITYTALLEQNGVVINQMNLG